MFETKICSKCKIEKEITEFYMSLGKPRSYCKKCGNEYHTNYVNKNKEKVKTKIKERYRKNIEQNRYKQRKYREENREKVDNYNKKYYKEHKDYFSNHAKQYRKEHLEEIRENDRKWREENKEKVREFKKLESRARMNDPIERAKNRVRNLIRDSFERKGRRKSQRTEEIIGCTIIELIEHLIKTYERNYNEEWEWKYLSEVHIDHIIPLYEAKTKEDVIRLCHYSNLQLLKRFDNLSKWKN